MWQLQSGAIWLKQCSGNHVILSRLQIPRRQNREQFHLKRSLCRISITPLLRWTGKGGERWRGEGFGRLPKNDIDWYWGQPAIFLQTQVKRYQSERQDFWKVRLPTHLCVFNCGSKPLDPLLLLVKSGRPGLYHYRQFQAIKVLKHSNSDDNYGHCQYVNCKWAASEGYHCK